MKRLLATLPLALVLTISACGAKTVCNLSGPLCEEELKPGRCIVDGDCPMSFVCGQTLGAPTFHTCVPTGPADAGTDSMGSDGSDSPVGDAQVGDARPTCQDNAGCVDETKPICPVAGGECVACTQSSDCGDMPGGRTFCETTSGRCVACLESSTCSPEAPICAAGTCRACNAEGLAENGCQMRNAALPVCLPNGQCAECDTNAHCTSIPKPICDQNACRSCTGDAECVAKAPSAPGVCMAHEDGRCASTEETVIVQGGDLQAAITDAVSNGKKLVVVQANSDRAVFAGPGTLSIVGKGAQRPAVGGGPSRAGLSVTGGSLFVRGLALTSSAPGLSVTGGSAQVVACTIRDNPGGGVFVNAATLVLSDSLVTRNGPGDDEGAIWGGLRLKAPAAGTKLDRVSLIDNNAPGASCTTAVVATAVLATGNSATNIAGTCQFMSCAAAGPTCGASQ